MGFEPTTLAIHYSRAVSYQLDYRDCPVAIEAVRVICFGSRFRNDDIIDVKFATGIILVLGFYPYIDVCENCILSSLQLGTR